MLQIGHDLLRHLGAQLQHADLLDQVGTQPARRLARRLALGGVEQPAAEDHDLLFQVGGRAGEMVDDVFHQQERAGHLDDHELVLPRIRVGQMLGDERNGVEQLEEVLVPELGGLAPERDDEFLEAARAALLARHVLHPGALQHFEPRMHVVERGLQPIHVEFHQSGRLRRLREQGLELVELLDLLDARRSRLALGDAVQHFAQQRFVFRLRSRREVAHPEIDPVAQGLGSRQPIGVRRLAQRVDQALRGPPHRLRLRQLRRHLVQTVQRLAHLAQPPRLSAQPRKQPALELRALRGQQQPEFPIAQALGSGVRREARRKIGEEQILLRAVRLALQGRKLPVLREQAQRHVRLAAPESIDKIAQRQHRPIDDPDRRARRLRAVSAGEAAFERFAELRRAAQPDHPQGAAHLVQVVRARPQHCRIPRLVRELRNAVANHGQGQIDLGRDPGQQRRVSAGHRELRQPSLKPATDFFRPSASAASRAAEAVVFLVPSVVSWVMASIAFMLAATFAAEADC